MHRSRDEGSEGLEGEPDEQPTPLWYWRRLLPEGAFATLPATTRSLANLRDGWVVEAFVEALPPLVIGRLRRHRIDGGATEERAYWLLDSDGYFLGNALDQVPPHLFARARRGLLDRLASRVDDVAAHARLLQQLQGLDRWFRIPLMRALFAGAPSGPLDVLGLASGDDDRFQVVDADGLLSILVDGALEFAMTVGGAQQAGFSLGWRASHVVTCFAPLLMVELRADDGRMATWVLDARFDRVDDDAFRHPATIEVLRTLAPPMIRRHWLQILSLADCEPGYDPPPMLRLNRHARTNLLDRVRDLVMPDTADQLLGKLDQPIVLPPAPGRPAEMVLPEQHVRHAVRHGLYHAGLDAIRQGRLVWPSPVDGSDATLEAVFAPQDYTIIYQFRDRNGLRFLVATGERDCVLIGLYLPLDNRFIGDVEPPNWWFRGHIPADFWMMLYGHCLRHAELLAGRRRTQAATIVNLFMAPPLLHLGHYVWNDLTGQAALVREVPDRLPTSQIIAGPLGQNEFFGPLETLFPPLAGRVDRSLPDIEAFVAATYGGDAVPIRFTRTYVDRSLRDLVRAAILPTDAFRDAREERSRLGAGPLIVVGIRLEDRTFVDPPAFYEALLDHLAARHPGAVVVLDGRNARPGGAPGEVIASIKDGQARRAPLDAELELVDHLRSYATGLDVHVASTVGLPIQASMAWCYLAAMCVAPWGAGLAKYRWLANLPSVILTSRHNLERRTDLDIYHAPTWMEQPTRLVFPAPNRVVDHPGRFGIAPGAEVVGRECFTVDMEHVLGLVSTMLAEVAATPAQAPHPGG